MFCSVQTLRNHVGRIHGPEALERLNTVNPKRNVGRPILKSNRREFCCTSCTRTFHSYAGVKYHVEKKHGPAALRNLFTAFTGLKGIIENDKADNRTEKTRRKNQKEWQEQQQKGDDFSNEKAGHESSSEPDLTDKSLSRTESSSGQDKNEHELQNKNTEEDESDIDSPMPQTEDSTDVKDGENESEHWCQVCRRGFTSRRNLRRHAYKWHNTLEESANFYSRAATQACPLLEELRCETCSRIFFTRNGLSYHVSSMHGKAARESLLALRKKKLWCSACDKMFSSGQALRCHIERIHGRGSAGEVDH